VGLEEITAHFPPFLSPSRLLSESMGSRPQRVTLPEREMDRGVITQAHY